MQISYDSTTNYCNSLKYMTQENDSESDIARKSRVDVSHTKLKL